MRAWLALLAALVATGCQSGGNGPEVAAACDESCSLAALDAPLAQGARLTLDPSAPDATGSAGLALMSARPEVLRLEGNELWGDEEGVSALLVTTAEGTVIDFAHVWVAEPTRIGFERDDTALSGALELLVGDELILSIAAYDGERRLLGTGESVWSATGEAVSVLSDGLGSRRRIVAREVGEASLAVSAFGMESSIDLEVLP